MVLSGCGSVLVVVFEKSTHQEEVMVFWLRSKIFKDALFPVSLHMIPIINESMTNRIMQPIGFRIGNGLVSDVEVKIFNSTLGCKISRL